MELKGGAKVIDIFSTTSQNYLVCAPEQARASFYMKSVRDQGRNLIKSFCVQRGNIPGTHQHFHSM
jgi:hypothetical protein